jgi:alpha-mannosidase
MAAMTLYDKLGALRSKAGQSYWAGRISAQIGYALKLSATRGHCHDGFVEGILDALLQSAEENGAVANPAAAEAERRLAAISKDAKSIQVICAAHAHIDMNWAWGFQETVSVVVETFRTILDLMREYPALVFSQSQAAVYRIVEQYDPDMLAEIRQMVKEGRWEVTASTWTESDKNMPNGESMARHILYAKRYLSELLGIAPDQMQLEFEPDSFGHCVSVPEILSKGGVKYYYHCRGHDSEWLYRWQSPSGARALVFRDPWWYGAAAEYDMFFDAPHWCAQYGVDAILKSYGVGDHGGGPTRRDIEMLSDMAAWPVMPSIKFGTYHEFFRLIEKRAPKLPVVAGELNFVHSGCYSSQDKIKMANRLSEDKLYASEAICAAAAALRGKSYAASFRDAWEGALFNQFHDILPGSGVGETRDFAMGLFQKTLAVINANISNAMRAIAQDIDTSSIAVERDSLSVSEGAGVGLWGSQHSGHWLEPRTQGYRFPQTERGNGKARIYHVFNATAFDREGPAELAVWDWPCDAARLRVADAAGNAVAWKQTRQPMSDWAHTAFKLAIYARVPAFGYATYILDEMPAQELPAAELRGDPRVDRSGDDDIVLENGLVRAVFRAGTMELISFADKAGKAGEKEFVEAGNPAAVFQYILEDETRGSTAWTSGNWARIENLNRRCAVRAYETSLDGIRKWIRYKMDFRSSSLDVAVYLDDNSKTLRFSILVDWHEIGAPGKGIPRLSFFAPFAGEAGMFRYDVPFGFIDRAGLNHDAPGNSLVAALLADGGAFVLATDTKHGFRAASTASAASGSLSVCLLRASFDPDPYPEYGVHTMTVGLALSDSQRNESLAAIRSELVHDLPWASGKRHAGSLPLGGRLFSMEGDALVSAVKTAEDSPDGQTLILRLYDANGAGAAVTLRFFKALKAASIVDLNENRLESLPVSGREVKFAIPPHQVVTVAAEV